MQIEEIKLQIIEMIESMPTFTNDDLENLEDYEREANRLIKKLFRITYKNIIEFQSGLIKELICNTK